MRPAGTRDALPFSVVRGSGEARASGRLIAAGELARRLRTPQSGLLGQGVRFGLAGGVVALVYLTATTVLADVVGLPFEVALAIGFCIAIMVHFTLQRVFVWTHHEEFALPLGHQVGRYLLVAGAQYGVTAASTSLMPSVLGVGTEVVYLGTVAVLLCVNFLVFRHGIFHAKPPAGTHAPGLDGTAK
jgi:putative flippase GtrA